MSHTPSNSKSLEKNHKQLRQEALDALKSGRLDVEGATEFQQSTIDQIMEELRIYHAELEIQNETLRLAQNEIETSQTNYETLFQNLPVAALIIDAMGVILEGNHEAMNLLGLTRRVHFVNHSLYRYLNEESGTWLSFSLNHLESEVIKQNTLEILTQQKSIFVDAHLIKYTTPSSVEEVTSKYIVIFADLTHEKAQQEQAKLLSTVLDASPAYIYAFDREGKCLMANQQLAELLGHTSVEEIIGKKRKDLFNEKDAIQHFLNDAKVFSTGEQHVFEELYKSSPSEVLHYLSHKFPLRNLQDEIYAVAGITTDITQQRRNESRLKIAMELFSKGTQGMLVVNADNKILFVNTAFEQITGYTEIEVLGEDPKILSSGRHSASFYEQMWEQINTHLKWSGKIWNKRQSGEIYPQWLEISVIQDDYGEVSHRLAVFSDISEKVAADEAINKLAFYDTLTNTPNRDLFLDRVNQKIREADRRGESFSILYLDLDYFKQINDTHGHDVGDKILIEVVQRIKSVIRKEDTLSRQGGDEFAILLDGNIELNHSEKLASKLIQLLSQPFGIKHQEMYLSASIGISHYPSHAKDYGSLIRFADIAMYEAKNSGRNAYKLFKPWMLETMESFTSIDHKLRKAIKNNQLTLVFQPQIDLSTEKIAGYETLLRWHDEELGWISPNDFIPVAEKTELIVELTDLVFETALKSLKTLQQKSLPAPRMSINISAKEFIQPDFTQRVAEHLKHAGVEDNQIIVLELTERVAMNNVQQMKCAFDSLKGLGVGFAMDDFGTGFSSLNILKTLPIDILKIDMSFVHGVEHSAEDQAVCQAIIGMAKALNLSTVVEGVETQAQRAFFKQNHATSVQGYYCAKPMPLDALCDWLLDREKLNLKYCNESQQIDS